MPGGWLHPRHHRSCLRHQLHRRNQSCMARPHIADRWSLEVAHDGSWSRNPWSGLNWKLWVAGVFGYTDPTLLNRITSSGRRSLRNCSGKQKKKNTLYIAIYCIYIANVWIVDIYRLCWPCSVGQKYHARPQVLLRLSLLGEGAHERLPQPPRPRRNRTKATGSGCFAAHPGSCNHGHVAFKFCCLNSHQVRKNMGISIVSIMCHSFTAQPCWWHGFLTWVWSTASDSPVPVVIERGNPTERKYCTQPGWNIGITCDGV